MCCHTLPLISPLSPLATNPSTSAPIVFDSTFQWSRLATTQFHSKAINFDVGPYHVITAIVSTIDPFPSAIYPFPKPTSISSASLYSNCLNAFTPAASIYWFPSYSTIESTGSTVDLGPPNLKSYSPI